MSEEENEIIHIISNYLMYCRGYETKKFTEKELFEALGKVGPLLEELHNEIAKYKRYIEERPKIGKDIQTFINLDYVKQEYVSKDKIREKIKELEGMSISQDIYYDDIKEMLEELLEE